MKRKLFQLYLDEEEKKKVEIIRRYHDQNSKSEAIRFAIEKLYQEIQKKYGG
jgi:Arc/MetJ-type ribon-helix-helix transcriptional regulator